MVPFVHTPIVSTIDPASIGAVIEASVNARLLSFSGTPGGLLHDDPSLVWADSGVYDGNFNSVVSAHLAADNVDDQIEAVIAYFRARSRAFTWHIGPSTKPADLADALIAHGLTLRESEPGMAIEIDRMREDLEIPAELTIETVHDAASLADWVSVWLPPVAEDVRRRQFSALLSLGVDETLPWQYFVGRLNGEPVATSEIFLSAGVAAVHQVVTMPSARRRGIGTAMTLKVLSEARDRGYRVGVLTASPAGQGVYRRIGFAEYCWFHRYSWRPGA